MEVSDHAARHVRNAFGSADFYDILQIDRNATETDIKRVFVKDSEYLVDL